MNTAFVFAEAPLRVSSVRVPGSGLAVKLSTQVGRPYDASTVAKDVRYLWGLGRFDDVKAEAETRADGVAVTFVVVPAPHFFLHEIRIVPNSYGLEIHLPAFTPMSPLRAHEIAAEARKQLNSQGYPNARVDYTLVPHRKNQMDLRLNVDPGEAPRVSAVRFEGDASQRRSLRALRSRRILFWKLLPSYSAEAVEADTARLRTAYVNKGYFDAAVSSRVERRGKNIEVTLSAVPGPLFPMEPNLCGGLLAERRQAQSRGELAFRATLDSESGIATEPARSYRVGRITFIGNHRFSDSAIRRNLVLDEGALFDERKLRASIARLTRTEWFQPIDQKDVIVHPDAETGIADVTILLVERKTGSWRLSGPVGPLSLAGPVQASIGSRLPPWGRGVFELSTYMASVSLFAFGKPLLPIANAPRGFTPVLAFSRPFTPGEGWKSGFAVAPSLGWKYGVAGYFASQLQERMLPRLSGRDSASPPLPVTVMRPWGEAAMSCEEPKPGLGLLRTSGALVLHFLGALPSL